MAKKMDRAALLKTVSPIMQLDAARNYKELNEALGVIINDMMQKERDGKKYDMGSDAVFVLGFIHGKMRSFQKRRQ